MFSSCAEKLKPSSERNGHKLKLSTRKHGLIFDRIERGDFHLRLSKVMVIFIAQSIAVIDPLLLRSYEWMSRAAHARSTRKFINKACVQCGARDRASPKHGRTRYSTRRNLFLRIQAFNFSDFIKEANATSAERDWTVTRNILRNTQQSSCCSCVYFCCHSFIHSFTQNK